MAKEIKYFSVPQFFFYSFAVITIRNRLSNKDELTVSGFYFIVVQCSYFKKIKFSFEIRTT